MALLTFESQTVAAAIYIVFQKVEVWEDSQGQDSPLYIQPVVVVRGLKRQEAAAFTNFVGCFLLSRLYKV